MRLTSPMRSYLAGCLTLGFALLVQSRAAEATHAYNNPGPFVEPWVSPTGPPSLPSPARVPGKELSTDGDISVVGTLAGPLYDAEQVIAWDGLGGSLDGIDYSDSSRPGRPAPGEVDALANFADTLFQESLSDTAHLVFSVAPRARDRVEGRHWFLPTFEPIALANGTVIGNPTELSYELAGAFAPASSQGLWASRSEIDASVIDALELWGPEPNLNASPPALGDSNRYSLQDDAQGGVSVWGWKKNPDNSYTSFPYVTHSMVVDAVLEQLGAAAGIPEQQLIPRIDVDALMAYDMPGTNTRVFDGLDPVDGPWDKIIFSIRQIYDPEDETGYYSTGSELFWLDASGASGFLHHGGHDWDKAYALENFLIVSPIPEEFDYEVALDISALEAVAVIPEPAADTIMLTALAMFGCRRRRNSS